jgi:hypothetical protein
MLLTKPQWAKTRIWQHKTIEANALVWFSSFYFFQVCPVRSKWFSALLKWISRRDKPRAKEASGHVADVVTWSVRCLLTELFTKLVSPGYTITNLVCSINSVICIQWNSHKKQHFRWSIFFSSVFDNRGCMPFASIQNKKKLQWQVS